MGTCHLCNTKIPDEALLAHIEDEHPKEWGNGPLRWPDGGLVMDASEVAEVSDFED